MKFNLTFPEILLFITILIAIHIYRKRKKIIRWWREWRKERRGPRQLRPRAPEDCPECNSWIHWFPKKPNREVVPWSEVKSNRGRKKTVDTSGYACLNLFCHYFGVTDAHIHALVSEGKRGKNKDIQYFRCQNCGKRRTSRIGTPMYCLKTSLSEVAQVVTALSEGLDISAATRVFGYHHKTISGWVTRMGKHSARLHERLFFRAIDSGHVQLDELVTKVKDSPDRVWVWTAICAQTKLIFGVHIGGRMIEDACSLMHQVWMRLKRDVFPVFTSDGLNRYFHGLTAHYGNWEKPPRARKYHWIPDIRLLYAQIVKSRSGRKLKFLKTVFQLGEKDVIQELLQELGFTGTIQTSYVERSNLTLREHVAPLSRRTWSIAYDIDHLWLHIQVGLAYYHLVRWHQSLRVSVRGPSKYRYRTPAMAAGLVKKRWSVAEILMVPVPERMELRPFPVA